MKSLTRDYTEGERCDVKGVYRNLNLATKCHFWQFPKLKRGGKREVGTEKVFTFSEVLLPDVVDSPSYESGQSGTGWLKEWSSYP